MPDKVTLVSTKTVPEFSTSPWMEAGPFAPRFALIVAFVAFVNTTPELTDNWLLYPGVTVSDIKKWNGISSNDLKPGMKLKING